MSANGIIRGLISRSWQKKRWTEDYSNQELGKMFDLSPVIIRQHLARLKNSNLLCELDLTENEPFQIKKSGTLKEESL